LGRHQQYAGRGYWALTQEHLELEKASVQTAGKVMWGIATAPVRIFTTDIPELVAVGSERMQGQGRGWDVILTASNLAGDVYLTYGICNAGIGLYNKTRPPQPQPSEGVIYVDPTELRWTQRTAGGEGNSNIVFRGLAADEIPANGLRARAPGAGDSPVSHVAGKRESQWISTTKDLSVIGKYGYGKHGVVAIDLSKVSTGIVDISDGIPGMPGMFSNWAKAQQEVLVKDYIPAEAIIWSSK
jgi:hypothetical protein